MCIIKFRLQYKQLFKYKLNNSNMKTFKFLIVFVIFMIKCSNGKNKSNMQNKINSAQNSNSNNKIKQSQDCDSPKMENEPLTCAVFIKKHIKLKDYRKSRGYFKLINEDPCIGIVNLKQLKEISDTLFSNNNETATKTLLPKYDVTEIKKEKYNNNLFFKVKKLYDPEIFGFTRGIHMFIPNDIIQLIKLYLYKNKYKSYFVSKNKIEDFFYYTGDMVNGKNIYKEFSRYFNENIESKKGENIKRGIELNKEINLIFNYYKFCLKNKLKSLAKPFQIVKILNYEHRVPCFMDICEEGGTITDISFSFWGDLYAGNIKIGIFNDNNEFKLVSDIVRKK
ncbi:MAG: hypothetical protein GY830_07530 [Bacteroidetes bacterium]|nr:hypothetical protein [Bacteroidota bacterium]